MEHTNLDRTTFWAQRAYNPDGSPAKPTRNVLAELGYVVVDGKYIYIGLKKNERS